MSRKKMVQVDNAQDLWVNFGRFRHRSVEERLRELANIGGAKNSKQAQKWIDTGYMPVKVRDYLTSHSVNIQMELDLEDRTEKVVTKTVKETTETISDKSTSVESYKFFFTARKKVMEDLTNCLVRATSEEERIEIVRCFGNMYHFEININKFEEEETNA